MKGCCAGGVAKNLVFVHNSALPRRVQEMLNKWKNEKKTCVFEDRPFASGSLRGRFWNPKCHPTALRNPNKSALKSKPKLHQASMQIERQRFANCFSCCVYIFVFLIWCCRFDCVYPRLGPRGPGLHGGVPGGAWLAVPGGGRGRRAPLPEPSLHSAPGSLHRHPAAQPGPRYSRVSGATSPPSGIKYFIWMEEYYIEI